MKNTSPECLPPIHSNSPSERRSVAPSQACDYEDGADSDAAIGFGIEAQNLASERQNGASDALTAYGAGYGGYFNSDTADATPPPRVR